MLYLLNASSVPRFPFTFNGVICWSNLAGIQHSLLKDNLGAGDTKMSKTQSLTSGHSQTRSCFLESIREDSVIFIMKLRSEDYEVQK